MDKQTNFLNSLNIPKLSEEDSRTLVERITGDSRCESATSMRAGKAAGLGGIPTDLYKIFQAKLLTPLLQLFQESFRNGLLPTSMRVALITVLPKPGKPNTKCKTCSQLTSEIQIQKYYAKFLQED